MIDVPEPNWDESEKNLDGEILDSIELTCDQCNEIFNASVFTSGSSYVVTIGEYPRVIVYTDPARFQPAFEDPYEYPLPDFPYDVFVDTYDQSIELLKQHGSESGTHLLNRMVFSQLVTALEAYLSDTLLIEIRDRFDIAQRLISGDTELKQMRFSLRDISEKPTLVQDTIRNYIRSISFHKLDKADALYKVAFRVSLLSDKEMKELLFKAMHYRHDCVHRNGRDKDGTVLTVFSRTYVKQIADLMRLLVDQVDDEIEKERANAVKEVSPISF